MNIILTTDIFLQYIDNITDKIYENKDYITDLDSATGDGDHWVNMNKGFQELKSKKDELAELNFNKMFQKTGMILMSSIGGSAGVLYGSAFIEGSKVIDDVKELDIKSIQKFIEAQLKGIMDRGKSEPGDKTMVDAIYNANENMKKAIKENKSDKEILESLALGAKEGAEKTKNMKAKRGRAYYQGDKGVGHLDPGAVTMYYQIDMLVNTILEKI